MISLILFLMASICSSVMDVTSFHFEQSIFRKLNPLFWSGSVSWKGKYVDWNNWKRERRKIFGKINFPVQLTDSFHLFKSLMICFLAASVVFYTPIPLPSKIESVKWLSVLCEIFIYGVTWNCTFSLFFDRILKKKG